MDEKTIRQTKISIYFIFFLYGFSTTTISPLIPIIAEQIQVGFDRIGIALFIGSIATLLSNFIAGSLSDRFDIKKMILFSLILLSAGFIMFGTYLNYAIFILVLIILRTGFAFLDTTIHSFTSKLFTKEISRVFLNLDISWYIGTVLGPLLISIFLYFNIMPRYLFFIFVLLYIAFIVLFQKIWPKKKILDNLPSFNRETGTPGVKRFSVLKDPAIIIGSLVLFFYCGAMMGFSAWMTTYLLSFGIKVMYGSAALSLFGIFSIVGMLITIRIISRVREITILIWASLTATICISLFCLIPNIYLKMVMMAIQAVFMACFYPLIISISARRSKENSGTIIGFNIAFAFGGSIVFQPIYGYIAEYLGKSYMAYFALGGSIIGLVFTIILFSIIWNKHS